MHIPEDFRERDFATIADIIRSRPLGALVTQQNGVIVADHIPFLLDVENRKLRTHVARANPVWKHAHPDRDALVIFTGVDHYVTPSWYPTKRKTGKVAPTWNYEAVHVYGRMRASDDPQFVRETVAALTRKHEDNRAAPWSIEDAPAEYVKARLAAVTALELTIMRIEAKRKLSQNLAPVDRTGVVDGLRAKQNEKAEEMARRMSAQKQPRMTISAEADD